MTFHQQYTFQVKFCQRGSNGAPEHCTNWSPHLMIDTYLNATCRNGYLERGINLSDQVCVTPTQHEQVIFDNGQQASRVVSGDTPHSDTCLDGFVWRDAFGGDHICVSPAERAQAASNNNQEASRIIAP